MPGILGNRAGTGRLQPWKGGQRDGYIMSIGYYDVVKSSVAYLEKKISILHCVCLESSCVHNTSCLGSARSEKCCLQGSNIASHCLSTLVSNTLPQYPGPVWTHTHLRTLPSISYQVIHQ